MRRESAGGVSAPRRRRWALSVCCVAAAGAHAALWVVAGQGQPLTRAVAVEPAREVPAVRVKLAARAPAEGQPQFLPPGLSETPVRRAQLEAPEVLHSSPQLAPVTMPLLDNEALPEAPALEPLYVPRGLLTRSPVAESSVLLSWPAQAPWRGSFTGVLRLYIDEQGTVRRVEPADEGLPEVLFEAARLAFQDTRFSPGELQGQAVRSVIRVEVSFENGPLNVTP